MSFESERLFRFIRKRAVVTIADILQRGPVYTRRAAVANAVLAELLSAGLVDDFPTKRHQKPYRRRLLQIHDSAMRLPASAEVAPPCRKYLRPPWTKGSAPKLEWRKLPNGKCKRVLTQQSISAVPHVMTTKEFYDLAMPYSYRDDGDERV